ncbi:MAG TPA: glycine-rich protein [Acidimicrobiia bacterium]
MALVKVRAWQAMTAAAAALVAGGVLPARADTTAGQDRMAPQNYTTECSTPRVDVGTRTCHYTFHYTRTIETFVVPPTTEPVQITAVGAPGSGAPGMQSRGATVTASFASLSGMPIFITVGGDGTFDGYNGGGLGGGGGASDIRIGGPELEHRVMVAGGGGGWGQQLTFDEKLGDYTLIKIKGGDAGQPGLGSGGQPGTLTKGGAGGGTEYAPGTPGSFGRGGAGAEGYGGGGGGYYGGGGAGGCVGSNAEGTALCLDSQPGSGGGGSSLLPATGSFLPTEDPTSRVTITVTHYGWWKP